MWAFYLEAVLALCLLVFIVWWTLPKNLDQRHASQKTGAAKQVDAAAETLAEAATKAAVDGATGSGNGNGGNNGTTDSTNSGTDAGKTSVKNSTAKHDATRG